MTEKTETFVDIYTRAGPHAIISPHVRWRYPDRCSIGAHSIVDDFCYISASLSLGRFSHISAGCTILGGAQQVTIGDFVDIAPHCDIVSASQDYTYGGLAGPCIPEGFQGHSLSDPIHLSDFVLLGSHTVILPGCHLPEGLATGAFTLLRPSDILKPWTLYVGCPARPLRPRCADKIVSAARWVKQTHPEVFP
jgi:acetyltransferase-like isoleucine patch superfamily enzyme